MIIPTPTYDPLYAADGVPFREKMIRYIEREFGDILRGQQLTDQGLDLNHGDPPAKKMSGRCRRLGEDLLDAA